jgi:hypothetical protein
MMSIMGFLEGFRLTWESPTPNNNRESYTTVLARDWLNGLRQAPLIGFPQLCHPITASASTLHGRGLPRVIHVTLVAFLPSGSVRLIQDQAHYRVAPSMKLPTWLCCVSS